jgi:hypothetical protein
MLDGEPEARRGRDGLPHSLGYCRGGPFLCGGRRARWVGADALGELFWLSD